MSVGAIIAIAVGGTLLMAGGIIWLVIWINRSNAAQERNALARLQEEMTRRGWTFAEQDDSYAEVFNTQPEFTLRNALQPFVAPPKAVGARNVITGVHRGRSFLSAEFDVRHQGQQVRVGAIWLRTPAMCPSLTVTKAIGAQSRVRSAIGQGDIQLGHPEFDQRFEITTESEPFARAVLTPQVVQFLLTDRRQAQGFAVYGDQFDVHDVVTDNRDPAQLVPALDLRCDLLDRIPPTVWAASER